MWATSCRAWRWCQLSRAVARPGMHSTAVTHRVALQMRSRTRHAKEFFSTLVDCGKGDRDWPQCWSCQARSDLAAMLSSLGCGQARMLK